MGTPLNRMAAVGAVSTTTRTITRMVTSKEASTIAKGRSQAELQSRRLKAANNNDRTLKCNFICKPQVLSNKRFEP